jgi:riboflavin kinase/FMN adenylyltransferase
VVTIGAFDGIHLGHQALLRLVRGKATERGLPTALVTFDRHPAQVVRPESAPKLLTNLDQKLELLEATGLVDHAVVLTFDDARRQESAEDFVTEVLGGCLQARLVVVGADFHFGNARRGNVALLERMGRDLGFEVVGLELVSSPGEITYSSTLVRRCLADGDVRGAAEILGRVHEVRGPVVEGDRRGRELGFPTANVAVPEEICLPAAGIYAGTFTGADGVERPAALSLGRRPTFYTDQPYLLLEAYLLDFEGDLYGQRAAVGFVDRIRSEERFESVEALVAAMGRDVEAVRRVLEPRQ